MGHATKAREQERKARARLRVLHHYEQVTRNVSQTCRFFGISRTLFYRWRDRYRQEGLPGLQDGPRGPRYHPFTTPPQVVALILEIRRERQYGPLRISFFLQRYHNVYVSAHTIHRILRRHRVPHVSRKRYRPGPRRRRELHVPGQSVQVDVKHLKLGGRRFYQFTAIDEATRYLCAQLDPLGDRLRRRIAPPLPGGHSADPDRSWLRVRNRLHLAPPRSRPRAPPDPARLPGKQREGRAQSPNRRG